MSDKIKVLNYENLKEIISKKPIICFYSENGACGPSGLFYVIFDDLSLYAYSTYYQESNKELIQQIINHVPELRSLIYIPDWKESPKRECQGDLESVYLGLGNHALIDEDIINKMNKELDYPTFVEISSKLVGYSLKGLFQFVKNEICKSN